MRVFITVIFQIIPGQIIPVPISIGAISDFAPVICDLPKIVAVLATIGDETKALRVYRKELLLAISVSDEASVDDLISLLPLNLMGFMENDIIHVTDKE